MWYASPNPVGLIPGTPAVDNIQLSENQSTATDKSNRSRVWITTLIPSPTLGRCCHHPLNVDINKRSEHCPQGTWTIPLLRLKETSNVPRNSAHKKSALREILTEQRCTCLQGVNAPLAGCRLLTTPCCSVDDPHCMDWGTKV